jgi:glycosyltransferase involved in cell wall biosynthesis
MHKKLDIMYVTHDSLSEGIGMSQIIPVVLGLSKSGWKVGVLSCEKTECPPDIQLEFENAGVVWIPLRFGRSGAIGGLGRLARIALYLPHARAFHCRGDLAAVAVVIRHRGKFLWDVRGLWIDQKIVIGSIAPNRYLVALAKQLERIAAKRAEAISTLTQAVYPVLKKRHPFISQPHFVIPTCTDLEKFAFQEELPTERKLLLSGVFNNYYDLPATEVFIRRFRERAPLKVTWCHGKEAEKQVLDVGEDEIKALRQSEMALEIQSSSFGIALCKKGIGESLTGVMPTKVAEFLAVGRPVVVSKGIGDLDNLLISTRTGVVVDDDIDDAIQELISLLEDVETPLRCRTLAEKHFNMSTAIRNYDSIFKEMM